MHCMREEKAKFGILISKELAKELSAIVKEGEYMKLTRSEVIEEMLEMVAEHIVDMEKFMEVLRGRIIERRKERARR